MTVEELMEILSEVEDKSQQVYLCSLLGGTEYHPLADVEAGVKFGGEKGALLSS